MHSEKRWKDTSSNGSAILRHLESDHPEKVKDQDIITALDAAQKSADDQSSWRRARSFVSVLVTIFIAITTTGLTICNQQVFDLVNELALISPLTLFSKSSNPDRPELPRLAYNYVREMFFKLRIVWKEDIHAVMKTKNYVLNYVLMISTTTKTNSTYPELYLGCQA